LKKKKSIEEDEYQDESQMHETSKSERVHDNGYRTKFDKRGDA